MFSAGCLLDPGTDVTCSAVGQLGGAAILATGRLFLNRFLRFFKFIFLMCWLTSESVQRNILILFIHKWWIIGVFYLKFPRLTSDLFFMPFHKIYGLQFNTHTLRHFNKSTHPILHPLCALLFSLPFTMPYHIINMCASQTTIFIYRTMFICNSISVSKSKNFSNVILNILQSTYEENKWLYYYY